MHDFHVHSSFSGDCKHSMENMVKGALKIGAKSIAFTDHIDYEYGNPDINFVFDIKDYLKDITKIRNKHSHDLQILSGLEICMQPKVCEKNKILVSDYNFDFIIMSTHVVKGLDLHEGDFFENKKVLDAYEEYYNEILNNLDSFNNFDVVGHLNLIDRYSKYMNGTISLADYRDLLIQVLEKIISLGKGIEINTSGIRYGINSFLPNIEILKLYKHLGGEIITIGSDAHTPTDICSNYEDAKILLKDLGYKYISFFKERKSRFIKIE